MPLRDHQRSLIIAGAVLFLLGLLQGGVVQLFQSPRMALSAHLTAVQSGTALIAAGAAWWFVSLPPRIAASARLAIIISMYGLWIGLTLAAATGASEALPIAGADYAAERPTEQIVTVIILISSTVMIAGWLVFVIGLMRRPDHDEP